MLLQKMSKQANKTDFDNNKKNVLFKQRPI